MKVQIAKLTVTMFDVVVPDRCPACGAVVVEYDLTPTVNVGRVLAITEQYVHFGGPADAKPLVTGYRCGCGQRLADAPSDVRHAADAPPRCETPGCHNETFGGVRICQECRFEEVEHAG